MITQLWELVVAPPEVPELSPGEIERTLEATGLPGLPSDYLELVKSYGVGCFDEFIFLLVPSAIREDLNLQVRGNEILAGYRQLAGIGKHDDNKLGLSVGNGIDGSEDLSYDVSVDKGELYPWAVTQNGDACFWHITGEDPGTWTVVVDAARDPAWERFDMSTTSFLYGVLSGSVAVEALPADFPSGNPAFREIAQ